MNERRFFVVELLVILAGLLFAWSAVTLDFIRFYSTEGTIFKVVDCVYPNPILTPCFYGAIGFLVAFVWAAMLLQKGDGARRRGHTYLMWFLLAGTIFGWVNFGKEFVGFYGPAGDQISCSGVPTDNPFMTSCFYGSILYSLAFLTAVYGTWRLSRVSRL